MTLERYFEAAVVARKETFDVIYEELSPIAIASPNDMETDDRAMMRMQQDIASVRLEMRNRAACIASATLAAGDKILESNIATIIKEISDKDGKREVISLWTLGEIGKRTKLDDSKGIDGTLWKKLEEDNSDEVKTAAAFAWRQSWSGGSSARPSSRRTSLPAGGCTPQDCSTWAANASQLSSRSWERADGRCRM